MLDKIRFKAPKFQNSNKNFQPGIYFYKFLAKKKENKLTEQNKFSLLQLWIPDTIVNESGIDPYWIYSGYDGYVYRSDKFYDRMIVSKLGNKYHLNELSAIIKYQD